MSATEFVAAARALISRRVRWRHRGRKPWALDCVGLVVVAARNAGLPCEDVKGYGREPWDHQLQKTLRERFGLPVSPPKPGDIAVIRWGKGQPSHVGIIGDHPTAGISLIHMHNLNGPCEQALEGPLRQSLVECYRPWQE